MFLLTAACCLHRVSCALHRVPCALSLVLLPCAAAAGKAPAAALPSVPAGRAPAAPAKTQEELELEALQAEMAL